MGVLAMRADTGMRSLAVGWTLHGWSRSDLLALAGVVAAIVIALVPPTRRSLLRWWQAALLRLGFPRRRYARWFVRTWGVYENPYLDDKENLDLSNTYVPLSFRSEEAGRETLSIAAAVLGNRDAGNLVIEGAPGSGKSTLLKAYGVGVLQGNRRILVQRERVVPFLIQLRKLASYNNGQISIADYLVNEILISSAGMKPKRAWQFLRYALTKDQVLVMLDGLDEVTADRYRAIHEAAYGFKNDHRPDCPSYRTRIVVTCRRQNFLSLRDEWIPAVASMMCTLAPLRNSEIFSYLNKLRPKFRAVGGPESFIQAVRASGTLDLHRVPLVLAMSVGMYARKDYFEIPSSIAELYQKMIKEMLDRHRFKRDPVGAAVTFQSGDKYRFLREFALRAARSGGFDEFANADLVGFGKLLAHDLDAVPDPVAFVEEIVQRSGLLTDVGETNRYVFAHRSIQEFLAADELRLADDGGFLLDKADDPEWRQVIQFYSVGLEQRQANAFLPKLSRRNPELASYCLAGAKVSDDTAATVLDVLQPVDGIHLAALTAATMSPRLSVQQMAINKLQQTLSSPHSPLSAISGDVDAMLPLLGSLAGTNAAQIAGLVPQITEHIPDDPRLVDPLWRCLTAPGIEKLPASHAIVARLLTLAINPDGFEELGRQEPYTRDFLTENIRRRAYPFAEGLDMGDNLVTLLAWADYLQVTPVEPNRYFDAKADGRLDRVEADRKRTVAFSPFRPIRVFVATLSLVAVTVAIVLVGTDPGRLLHPFGWWTLALILAAAVIPLGIFLLVNYLCEERLPDGSRFNLFFSMDDAKESGYILTEWYVVPDWLVPALGMVIVPIAIAVALLPLMAASLTMYAAVTLVVGFSYWLQTIAGFSKGRTYYLYRPSPYIDIYDDPRSRHWVVGA